MEPFKAIIIPLQPPTKPPIGGGGNIPRPDHDLPLFPFVPIVVPPGGAWPGEPPSGSAERPNQDLPLFPFFPIVVPPGGSYPDNTLPPTEPPPVDPNAPHPDQTLPGDLPPDQTTPPDPNAPKPEHPINLPPSEGGWWVFVYVPGIGWSWIAFTPGGDLPENPNPAPK